MTTAEGEGFQIDNEAFLLCFKGKNLLPNCSKFIQLSFEFPFTLFLVSHSMSTRVSDYLRPSFRVVGFQHYASITSRHTLALFVV